MLDTVDLFSGGANLVPLEPVEVMDLGELYSYNFIYSEFSGH